MAGLTYVGITGYDSPDPTVVVLVRFRRPLQEFSVLHITGFERTSVLARETRLSLSLLFICVTLTLPSPFTFINSVLPTKHLFGHDRP